MRVTIVIPTFRRNAALLRALSSAIAQRAPDLCSDILIVDNSPEAGARAAVEAFLADDRIRYVHEPRPGVSHARNAAIAAGVADFVAFLDDDQEAGPGWLAALAAVQRAGDYDVVFGPKRARLPEGRFAHRAYIEWLYSGDADYPTGPIKAFFGAGNSLVRTATVLPGRAPFPLHANECGGEDDFVFAAAEARGARFAWAAEAAVIEHVDPARASLAHALKRAMAYGQGPVERALASTPVDWVGLARHTIVGAGQLVVFGAGAALLFLLARPKAVFLLDRAARGLGKLTPWARHKFYGATLAARTSTAA